MNKNQEHKDVEYGIDSRYNSEKEALEDGSLLMKARIERMKTLSSAQIAKAKLLQLQYQMEEYIENPVHYETTAFTKFLSTYIDTLYQKRIHFAEDLSIKPVALSQILNNHREPNEEFIKKLMVHSELIYKDSKSFKKKSWYQIFLQEKINFMMSRQDEWRSDVEKNIHINHAIKLS